MGVWKLIIPETSTNMVLNPVAMGTGNYTQRAGTTVTIISTSSYLGYKCYRVETNADTEGIQFTLITPAAATHYVSMRVRGTLPAGWGWSMDNVVIRTPALVATEGDWSVYGYEFPAADIAAAQLYVVQVGAGAGDFYIGHVQVEQKTYRTTPITGDLKGFVKNSKGKSTGYYWNGAAHESSSVRTAQERHGGVEVDIETSYNFKVLYGLGSGMPPMTHLTQGMALLPGALFQDAKIQPRVLDLFSATDVEAPTVAKVRKARKDFINAIKLDKVTPIQPTVIRYYGVNPLKPVQFYGYIDSGLGFDMSSGMIDKPTARFVCYDPFCYETHTESTTLTTMLGVANADYVARKINGLGIT